MKTATVSDLRCAFGRICKWLEAGETVQIVNRGKPFARIMPEPKKTKTFLGACPSSSPLPSDIDDPVRIEWDELLLEGLDSGASVRMTTARKKNIYRQELGKNA